MKNLTKKLRIQLILASCIILSSCGDDDDTITITFSEENAAEFIATTLSSDDGGLLNDIEYMIDYVGEECGLTNTEEFSDTEDLAGGRSYSLEYELSLAVICDDDDNFQLMEYNYTVNREADLLRLDAVSEAVGDWELREEGANYLFEGSYTYSGEEVFEFDDDSTYETEATISSEDLQTDDAGNILDGTLSVAFEIVLGSEEISSGSGSLDITDTNTGLLDIESFEYLYEIDLEDGDVTEVERP